MQEKKLFIERKEKIKRDIEKARVKVEEGARERARQIALEKTRDDVEEYADQCAREIAKQNSPSGRARQRASEIAEQRTQYGSFH